MSIPDKFYRIAKSKLGDLKEWFDQVDEEREARAEADYLRKRNASDARRELEESLSTPDASTPPTSTLPASPPTFTSRAERAVPPPPAPLPRRTPEEISRGVQASTGRSTPPSAATGATTAPSAPDPLDYHYRLLGLEAGAEFAAVQTAYNKLAARCDPARFPAGSPEESQAREIRQRLDTSFKTLRDVLDTTARRFDLLEFDTPPPPAANPEAPLETPSSKADHLEI